MTHEEIIMQLSQVIAEQQKKIKEIESIKVFYATKCAELEAKLAEGKNGK